MSTRKEEKQDEWIVLLADRMAILMVTFWSKYCEDNPKGREFAPLDDVYFWESSACEEIRKMPEFTRAKQRVREMLT